MRGGKLHWRKRNTVKECWGFIFILWKFFHRVTGLLIIWFSCMFTFRLSSRWERSRLSVNSLVPTTHVCWLRNNPYIESMKASVAVLMPRTCSLWGYGNCCGISVITDKWLPRLKNFYLMMWDCIQITSVSDWAGLVVWLLWNKGLFSWKNLSVAKEHLRRDTMKCSFRSRWKSCCHPSRLSGMKTLMPTIPLIHVAFI